MFNNGKYSVNSAAQCALFMFNLTYLYMDLVLKIITFGLYGLFSKSRKLKQKVTKVKYNDDGSVKKKIDRSTEYDSDEAPTPEVE